MRIMQKLYATLSMPLYFIQKWTQYQTEMQTYVIPGALPCPVIMIY